MRKPNPLELLEKYLNNVNRILNKVHQKNKTIFLKSLLNYKLKKNK